MKIFPKKKIWPYISERLPIPTSFSFTGDAINGLKCVMFDIYGTLFISDSGDLGLMRQQLHHSESFRKLIYHFGINEEPMAILEAFFKKIAITHDQMKKVGVDFPEVKIDTIWKDVLGLDIRMAREFAVFFEVMANPVYPMPNLEMALAEIKKRKIQMGIISNAQFYTPFLFDWFLDSPMNTLGFHKDLLFWSYREGVAKPSPHLFERAADTLLKMDISPETVLYIGNDMRNDILPARLKGFKTALFAGDNRSLRLRKELPELKNIRPDIVMTDLSQISLVIA
ncbi:MAG: HAD family hydrolase [Proteobacteria bacterium]|nr:HAD family hydrolase [Pseudomonadota bacterium]